MSRLLIVPYGIETCFLKVFSLLDSLLIVPYGIETAQSTLRKMQMSELLIVPYGIETYALCSRF